MLQEAANAASAIEHAWDLSPLEVIVVDGGSDDGTREIAAASLCQLISSPAGRGIQLNRGAQAAQGDMLLFLHADTWLEPGARTQIEECLAQPHNLGGAFLQRIDSSGMIYRSLEWGNAARVRWLGRPFGDQGIFCRRDTFQELGGFPEVPIMEDVLFMKRFRRVAWPVLLPGPLHVSARRWRKRGVLTQTVRNWCLQAALRMGVSPDRLAQYYPHP